ncbi:DUF4286 family protein [Sphingobacterium pedocola]|uniref:DUF4286 domain-containing protein n=1 Tax=Sphingobacterium pedocola TaxID=2082722 RepID=A0ABR9T1I8_9SPHI|nr:DUF4286 family protein [Sphingobacterium pedocola]MBE8719222.1 DUF4286 domain-containing protein [Sphingobacterium pedocola]
MYLYNISIIVDDENHQQLINWVKKDWLSKIQGEVKFLKMLNTPHEGSTYCVQIIADNEQAIYSFQKEYVSVLQEHIALYYLEKAFIFDSTMEYISNIDEST